MMEQIEYTLPAHWAPYLINGDATGLSDKEQHQIDIFLASRNLLAPVSCSDESWFAYRNDSGNVLTFIFLI